MALRLPMRCERPRRFIFSGSIEVVDRASQATLKERTTDLSLSGCYVRTFRPFPLNTEVRIRIVYRGGAFNALAQVAHVREGGMGLQFTQIAAKDAFILEIWMAELRGEISRQSA